MKIRSIVLLIFALTLFATLMVIYEPYLLTGTPYSRGSGEWVGYTAAEANGFKHDNDCLSDPETLHLEGFVIGCMRYTGR